MWRLGNKKSRRRLLCEIGVARRRDAGLEFCVLVAPQRAFTFAFEFEKQFRESDAQHAARAHEPGKCADLTRPRCPGPARARRAARCAPSVSICRAHLVCRLVARFLRVRRTRLADPGALGSCANSCCSLRVESIRRSRRAPSVEKKCAPRRTNLSRARSATGPCRADSRACPVQQCARRFRKRK